MGWYLVVNEGLKGFDARGFFGKEARDGVRAASDFSQTQVRLREVAPENRSVSEELLCEIRVYSVIPASSEFEIDETG